MTTRRPNPPYSWIECTDPADVAVGCLEVVRRAGIAAVAGAGCAFASALCAPTVIVTIYMAVPLPCALPRVPTVLMTINKTVPLPYALTIFMKLMRQCLCLVFCLSS